MRRPRADSLWLKLEENKRLQRDCRSIPLSAPEFVTKEILMRFARWCLYASFSLICQFTMAGDLPNPFPVVHSPIEQPIVWSFPDQAELWRATRDCRLAKSPDGNSILFESTGIDPIVVRSGLNLESPFEIFIAYRTASATSAQLFWDQSGKDRFTESDSQRFEFIGDDKWHEQRINVPLAGVRSLRFDPASSPCQIEVREIRIQPYRASEFEIAQVNWLSDQEVQLTIKSLSDSNVMVRVQARPEKSSQSVDSKDITLEPKTASTVVLKVPMSAEAAESIVLSGVSANSSSSRASVRVNALLQLSSGIDREQVLRGWGTLETPDRSLKVAPDGSAAILFRRDTPQSAWQVIACLAPLSWDRERLERFEFRKPALSISGESNNSRITLSLADSRLEIVRESKKDAEGPVVRIPGKIEQGLLAGVEHLGSGEASSSDIDIANDDRFRYEPPPHYLTMQLATIVTQRITTSLRWNNPRLQPVFATPNFFDGTDESRISWRGTEVLATLQTLRGWQDGGRLEDAVLEYVNARGGLPQIPKAPRSQASQRQLDMAGFLRSELLSPQAGWYHAIMPGSHGMPTQSHWFGDHASALLSLEVPLPIEGSKVVRGGSHIANDRWMFLLGRAQEWRQSQSQSLKLLIDKQQPDGSVIHDGQWSEGHFEKTSSGQCGMLAEQLMLIAWHTGSSEALQAGLKTLDYSKRFRTPRGAQVWECPLHAPDLMASAHLTRAFFLAWRMTNRPEYRELAVRWAISGLPFVYQWSESERTEAMPYATIATLCATHRIAPLWIGRPVQWCGIVYADAVLELADVDQTIDWRGLAEGIYRSATHQQYTDGPSVGLLPDSVFPTSLRRFPLDINPATIVLLGQRLAQQPVRLEVAVVDGKHIVSPWPMKVQTQHISFDTQGTSAEFQIAIDGKISTQPASQTLARPIQ